MRVNYLLLSEVASSPSEIGSSFRPPLRFSCGLFTGSTSEMVFAIRKPDDLAEESKV